MIRFLAALFFLVPSLAFASPCTVPSFYDGYSGQFFPTPDYIPETTGFIYGFDEQILYVSFYNGSMTGFSAVPQQIAENFNYSKQPDTFYQTQILGIYKETYICGNPPLD